MLARPLAAALLLGASSLAAQPTDANRAARLAAAFPEVDRVFREYAERVHIPGAAWGIVVDGRLVHIGTHGVRDVAMRAPVDSHSVFRIASMTKSFTAMAVMKLRDDGRLALDDPVEKWVPELQGLRYPTTDAPRITIRHLLTHAEGFPEDNPWGDQQLAASEAEFSAMMRGGIPFSTAPGTAYEYSNYGFAILGRVVTNAAGMPYNDYLRRHILQPLGMTSTTMSPTAVAPGRLAQGYRWEDETWKLEPQLPDGAFGPMGGMLTSIRDLGTYVAAYLAAFPPRDGAETAPVRRASLREMQQVARYATPSVTRTATGGVRLAAGGYGYGLRVSSDCNFAHVVSHTGGLPGFGSIMRWLPEHGVGIVAFGNRTYSGWTPTTDSALAILAATGAMTPRVPTPAPALVQRWDDRLADSVAAVNLFLDRSRDRRQAEIARLVEKVGPCRPGAGFDVVENALRGQWVMPCERGFLRASITLAPTMPPTVQYLEVREVPNAEPPRRGVCGG